ncbi:MAG: ABC transporter ATP-binding protein [Candidatus Methylomirabilota bacterium]
MTAPILEGRELRVSYGGQPTLDIPQVEVREGEVLAVIGPNGAGKSTLLRVLGLLEAPAAGTVYYRGQPVLPSGREGLAIRRRFASVFQEPLLCDATVRANAGLGLWLRGTPAAEAAGGVQAWLERLGIAHLGDRQARTLSGGEAQRTSLARAFAVRPEVLLLDEPFSALDPPTRAELLTLLQALLRDEGCTTLFVTHDREEALRLGDRIAVVAEGGVAQIGPPGEVFGRPASAAVARFVGVETILPGRVLTDRDGLLTVQVEGAEIQAVGSLAVGTEVLACLRPEDLTLKRPWGENHKDSARNHLMGLVADVIPLGAQVRVELDCGVRLISLVTKQSAEEMEVRPGAVMGVTFKATAVHLIPR